ncbi:unnamed protein product [Brachionus calyciflorus]|uniref:Phospholipid scramblase n=1 Tax=Brachionus calyciflorus TaxID=104777 RepID=A0A813ND77_9BILA|nr:unnamed protein product [Brachionus calyciflorus]
MSQIHPPAPNGQPIVWMQKPQPIAGCPPGLEYLTTLDSLFLKQKVSFLEAFTGWDTNNKYSIHNNQGNQIYFAAEQTEGCMRFCCGAQRGFQIFILDNMNQQVMKVSREFKYCAQSNWFAGCCDCCAHEVTVEAPVGTVVGYVKQKGSFIKAHYDILDDNHEPVLKVKGPCCILDGPLCPCENEFQLLTLDESSQIGKLSKDYAGFVKEMFTLADNFSIKFPVDLSVKTKATLIGALFLIINYHRDSKPDSKQYNDQTFIQPKLLPSVADCTAIKDFFNRLIDDIIINNELRAFIGLLLLFGLTRKNKVDVSEIWKIGSVDHCDWATAAMSRNRFKSIMSYLTFDDIQTRAIRLNKTQNDKFSKFQ